MPIKIKIPSSPAAAAPAPAQEEDKTQASINLQVTKTLDGNLLINDHKFIDIVVVPSTQTVLTMPKPYVDKDVFEYQQDLMYSLFKGGVTAAMTPQGSGMFGIVETRYPAEADVDPLQSVLYIIERFITKTRYDEEVYDNYDENIEDNFVDPPADKTTPYGKIPPYQDTPEGNQVGDPTYTFAGYGYYY